MTKFSKNNNNIQNNKTLQKTPQNTQQMHMAFILLFSTVYV